MNKYEENTSFAEQRTSAADVCANCGAALEAGQTFCPKCGAPKKTPERSVCTKCGAELQKGQEFCPNCGQKVALAGNATAGRKKSPAKKKVVAIAIIAGAVILLAALAVIFVPKIFKSAEDYMALGDYEKAYAAAKTQDEKNAVMAENAVAFCSKMVLEEFYNSAGFELRNAWIDYNYDKSSITQIFVYICSADHLYYRCVYHAGPNEWLGPYVIEETEKGFYYRFVFTKESGVNNDSIERINALCESNQLKVATFIDLDALLNSAD